MSFLAGLKSFASSPAGAVVQIAALAFIAKRMASNAAPQNNIPQTSEPNIDAGVREQVNASTSNSVPVAYGTSYFGGILTDAQMTNSNKTMWYCLTLSEKTGTKLSDNQPSAYVFKDIYWNKQRIIFKTDGQTVDYTLDADGNQDISLRDQVKVYCYAGNSTSPKIPENYTNTSTTAAYNLMPDWTNTTHNMNDLIFILVRVDYNREKNVTGLGEVVVELQNSMFLPGDVLYDYMTNTRYGAGITPAEILTV
jgi:hypothetical protein